MIRSLGWLTIAALLLPWSDPAGGPRQATPALSDESNFEVFDAPGAGRDAGQGTNPWSINQNGDITGVVIDGQGVPHGFLRHKSGSLISFDAPNASRHADQGTTARSINSAGEIAGYYYAPSGVRCGFIRHPDGGFTTFDPPGSAGTVINSINDQGESAGNFVVNDEAHGLLGRRDGSFLTFDPPGSFNTAPEWISNHGEITGYYEDETGVLHGFVRHKDGTFTTVDVPDATAAEGKGTFPMVLSEDGEVAGHHSAGVSGADRGFLLHKGGTIDHLDPPGSITDSLIHADAEGYELRAVTAPLSVNAQGEIAGYFDDSTGFVHGFVRHPDGTFATFEVPGATPGSGLGTFPSSLNNAGEVTGFYYTGAIGVPHGFVMSRSRPAVRSRPR
jgi:hypothetical protein